MNKKAKYSLFSVFIISIFLAVLYLASIISATNFVYPTPDNGTLTYNSSVNINISIPESNLSYFLFDWNNTNYTFYDNQLMLMMNFDNQSSLGENDTYIKDLSVHDSYGTIVGTTLVNSTGKYGGTFKYDGSSSYITIPDSDSLTPTGNLTVSAWIKSTGSSATPIVSKYKSDNTNREYYIYVDCVNDGDFIYDWGVYDESNGGSYIFARNSSSSILCDGNWHFITGVWNGTSDNTGLQSYIDGQPIKVTRSAYGSITKITNGNSNVDIGFGSWYNGHWNGLIDEVRIWNNSFTPEQVNQMYNSNLNKFNSNQWYYQTIQNGLTPQTYTYFGYSINSSGYSNLTDIRTLEITNPPQVGISLIYPNTSLVNMTKNRLSNISINVSCFNYDCGNINVSIFNITSLISNVTGELPFYINHSNPQVINLNKSQSKIIIFYLNSTGNSTIYFSGDFAPHNMSDASTPAPYVASESSAWGGTYGAWYLFNGIAGGNAYLTSNTGYWELDTGVATLLTSYGFTSSSTGESLRAPKDWTIQGSNDGSSWNTVDTVSGETGWGTAENRNYTCDVATTAYRYFKMDITGNNGDGSFTMGNELYFYTNGTSIIDYSFIAYANVTSSPSKSNQTSIWKANILEINVTDENYPIFSNFYDNNASLNGRGIANFNVTITNTNGTVLLQINNTNYTATNLTSNIYNVSVNFTNNETYAYQWISWGNGTDNLFNISNTRYYFLNSSTLPPNITLLKPEESTYYTFDSVQLLVNLTVSSSNGLSSVWWSNGFVNKSLIGVINNESYSSNINFEQPADTLKLYKLTFCANTSNNIVSCVSRNVTIKINPSSLQQIGTGFGGGGSQGAFSLVVNGSNSTNIINAINYTQSKPNNIIQELEDNANYIAEKISPDNHQLGLFILLVGVIVIFSLFLFKDKIIGVNLKGLWR